MIVRLATVNDIPELVRLRTLFYAALGRDTNLSAQWREATEQAFTDRLSSDGAMAVFVIDGNAGLAACAVGSVDRRLPGPETTNGLWGHVSGVVTDPDYRRRGYARLLMTALLDWFQARGIRRVELRASAQAEQLYRELGFADRRDTALTWMAGD